MQADEGGERGVDLVFAPGLEDKELHPLRVCRVERDGLSAGGRRIRTLGPPVGDSIFSRPPRDPATTNRPGSQNWILTIDKVRFTVRCARLAPAMISTPGHRASRRRQRGPCQPGRYSDSSRPLPGDGVRIGHQAALPFRNLAMTRDFLDSPSEKMQAPYIKGARSGR